MATSGSSASLLQGGADFAGEKEKRSYFEQIMRYTSRAYLPRRIRWSLQKTFFMFHVSPFTRQLHNITTASSHTSKRQMTHLARDVLTYAPTPMALFGIFVRHSHSHTSFLCHIYHRQSAGFWATLNLSTGDRLNVTQME